MCAHSIPNLPRFSLLSVLLFLVRFWGWSENEREAALDLAELRARAQQNLPLYGESDQPEWVQQAAYSNSVWSQLKFREFVRLYPRISPHSFLVSAEAFPMFVLIRSVLGDSLLTDTPGSTLSTTSIMVQTGLSTSNNCTVGHYIIHPLYSASLSSMLLLPIHTRLLAVLRQFVDNALPHRVVDRFGFP